MDSQLLRLQGNHRSSKINNTDPHSQCIKLRHCHLFAPDASLKPILQLTGFYPLSILAYLCTNIDPSLITALVERWRPETHTFHLPSGECTVTLQDVSLLLGVNVNGKPVTGPTYFDWEEQCMELLGKVPVEGLDLRGNELKLSWLIDNFTTVPTNASQQQREHFCRGYILLLIGGVLLPDRSGSRVHLMYLHLLRDLDKIRRYSWGSACLANLYREMCRGSKAGTKAMGGCMLLLQSWAWYRIPFIAPSIDRAFSYPYASHWAQGDLNFTGVPKGDLISYRARIDHIQPYEFNWLCFNDSEDNLPSQVIDDKKIWTACTSLICFSIVEWHQSDRVKLQFGMVQDVPVSPQNLDELHSIDKRGNHDVNWAVRHASWIQIWKDRRNRLLQGPLLQGPMLHSQEYMIWFLTNSRPFLSSDSLLRDLRMALGLSAISSQNPIIQQPRMTFDYTPGYQHDFQEHSQGQRYSLAETDSDYMFNFFAANVGTPESSNAMMQNVTSQLSPRSQPTASTSNNPNFSVDHTISVDPPPATTSTVQEYPIQQPIEQSRILPDSLRRVIPNSIRRILPNRLRNRRKCGTGSHLV